MIEIKIGTLTIKWGREFVNPLSTLEFTHERINNEPQGNFLARDFKNTPTIIKLSVEEHESDALDRHVQLLTSVGEHEPWQFEKWRRAYENALNTLMCGSARGYEEAENGPRRYFYKFLMTSEEALAFRIRASSSWWHFHNIKLTKYIYDPIESAARAWRAVRRSL
jgi:hypothetical protein